MILRCILALALVFSEAGCGLWPHKKPPKAAANAATKENAGSSQRFLGTISTINEAGKFVLVDFGGFTAPSPGSDLEVRRGSATVATLRAGSEMRRPFAAADILTGEPLAGDDVWSKNP